MQVARSRERGWAVVGERWVDFDAHESVGTIRLSIDGLEHVECRVDVAQHQLPIRVNWFGLLANE